MALLLLLLACAGCTRIVDAVLYRPKRPLPTAPGAVGLDYEELRFPAADGTRLHGWWVPGDPDAPCVLVFHGSRGNVSDRIDILRLLHDRLGLGILLFDYRGYGKSDGEPSEAGLYADGLGAATLVRHRGWDRVGSIYFGRGLGAAVAIELAGQVVPACLVVEGAFTSLEELARSRYPLLWNLFAPWVDARYDSLPKASSIEVPILFLHGDRDEHSPIALAWKLYDAAGEPKWFRTIGGAGHGDPAFVGGEDYWQAWEMLLAASRATAEARE
jgi:fermentation-respiration switch protein FrsA (DUF1100 family)